MWDCEHCGTTSIAGSLETCPHCQTDRTQEPVGTAAPTEAAEEGADSSVEKTLSSPSSPQTAADKKGAW
jgi:hypothetical protein